MRIKSTIKKFKFPFDKSIVVLGLVVLIFLYYIRNLKFGQSWSFADLLSFNMNKNLELFISAWNSNLLGYPYRTDTIELFYYVFYLFSGNNALAQNLYYVTTIPLSFILMYYFSKLFIKDRIGRIFASFVYAINPVTIGEFYNGSDWMYVYAFAPLVILLTIRFLESNKIQVLYGLTMALLIGVSHSNIWILFWTIIYPISIIMVVGLFTSRKRRTKKILLKTVWLIFFIFVGLLLLLPALDFLFQIKENSFNEVTINSYLSDVKYIYKSATPLRLIRIAGNAGSPMDLLGFNDDTWWSLFGFVIPLIAIPSLIKYRRNKYLQALALILIITFLFMYLTYLGYTEVLFIKFYYLFSLRNPKYLMYSYCFAISIFFGLGISRINNNTNTLKKVLILSVILASLFIYAYPLWDGHFGLSKKSADYAIPDYYFSLFDFLKKNDADDNYRVLWLPYTRTIQTRLFNNINHVGTTSGHQLNQTPSSSLVSGLYASIQKNKTKDIAIKLGRMNVKYIVIDKNYTSKKQQEAYVPWIPNKIEVYNQQFATFIRGPPYGFMKFFDKVDGLKVNYSDENYIVYENKYFRPYVYLLDLNNKTSFSVKQISEIVLTDNNLNQSVSTLNNVSRGIDNFKVHIATSGPKLLVLSESYDNDWVANINNIQLAHFKIFNWANAYLIPENLNGEIKISYTPTTTRHIILLITVVIWILVIIIWLFLLINHKKLTIK